MVLTEFHIHFPFSFLWPNNAIQTDEKITTDMKRNAMQRTNEWKIQTNSKVDTFASIPLMRTHKNHFFSLLLFFFFSIVSFI